MMVFNMIKLDGIDLKIIYYLRENARMTVSELSKKIGVSRPTIKTHLEKLERNKIIKGYTVRLSSELLKHNIVLSIIETENSKIMEKIDNIIEINKISSTKYLIKININDFESLKEFFNINELKIVEIMPVIESMEKDIKLKIKVPFKCDYCGKVITDEPMIYKYRNKIYFFCCRTCLRTFKKSQRIVDKMKK